MGDGADDACKPQKTPAKKMVKDGHDKEAEKSPGQAVEKGHHLPREYAAKDDADNEDNQGFFPCGAGQKYESHNVCQPQFDAGNGHQGGIMDSSINMVRAMAAKRARTVSFFTDFIGASFWISGKPFVTVLSGLLNDCVKAGAFPAADLNDKFVGQAGNWGQACGYIAGVDAYFVRACGVDDGDASGLYPDSVGAAQVTGYCKFKWFPYLAQINSAYTLTMLINGGNVAFSGKKAEGENRAHAHRQQKDCDDQADFCFFCHGLFLLSFCLSFCLNFCLSF